MVIKPGLDYNKRETVNKYTMDKFASLVEYVLFDTDHKVDLNEIKLEKESDSLTYRASSSFNKIKTKLKGLGPVYENNKIKIKLKDLGPMYERVLETELNNFKNTVKRGYVHPLVSLIKSYSNKEIPTTVENLKVEELPEKVGLGPTGLKEISYKLTKFKELDCKLIKEIPYDRRSQIIITIHSDGKNKYRLESAIAPSMISEALGSGRELDSAVLENIDSDDEANNTMKGHDIGLGYIIDIENFGKPSFENPIKKHEDHYGK